MLFTAPSHAHTAAGVKANDQYGEQFVIMFNLFMVQLKQVHTCSTELSCRYTKRMIVLDLICQ